MKNYQKNQKVIERKPKSKLVRVAIACGLIGVAGIGAGVISYLTSPKYETIFERRARYLNIANEQLLNAQTLEEVNGLSAIIKDIENGVYDYPK